MIEVLPRVELGSLDSKSRVLDHYTTEPDVLTVRSRTNQSELRFSIQSVVRLAVLQQKSH